MLSESMDWHEIPVLVQNSLQDLAWQAQKIPGSAIAVRYVKSSYQNDPVRSAIELFLFLFALRYLLAPSYSVKKDKGYVKLSEDEIDDLVDDWTPEPLVSAPTAFEEAELEKRPVIVGPTSPKTKLANGRTVTNLASQNFYAFADQPALKEKAVATLRAYGVGPCSPPNFYGTQDVHMKAEADIAAHIGVSACILYAQALTAIQSVIPSFAKRGDIIVCDKAVSYSVRKGVQISRSTVRWFEHNDYEDLERVLARVTKEQRAKPLTRRFIVTEGVFENVGDMADLPKLIDLKLRYKFRLILEESHSFGVLGPHGRGLTEHQNVDPTLVDMIVGSLAGALCAGGGFCAGGTDIVEHQRISSAAYTFSAALPAMSATTASETIALLSEKPNLVRELRENTRALRTQLEKQEFVRITSHPDVPMCVLVIKVEIVAARGWNTDDEEKALQEVVDECLNQGVLLTRVKSMPLPIGVAGKDLGFKCRVAFK
ncbi:MAG: hypothetical protein Q9159_003087, partial [Coniocarpon cinnabarinum]